MPDYSKFYDARNVITDILQQDLVGPVKDDEILSELPTQYYIMGKLYPQNNMADPVDTARNPLLENETDLYDASVSLSNQRNPSSLGVTCTLKEGVRSIVLSGQYAFYVPVSFESAASAGISTERWKDSDVHPETFWKRTCQSYRIEYRFDHTEEREPIKIPGGMELLVCTHTVLPDRRRIITAVLMNGNHTDGMQESTAERCAFQVSLKIEGQEGTSIFSDTVNQTQFTTDDELRELEMLYSDSKCYGQGHGCSVVWDMEHEEPLWVASTYLPGFDLRQMMAAQTADSHVLSMKYLASEKAETVFEKLHQFIDGYKKWIDNTEARIVMLSEAHRGCAVENMQKCRQAALRMEKSVKLMENGLQNDGKAYRAFQLANEAMLLQRSQTLIKSGKTVDPARITWYPFQLAFILHELSSFIDPTSEERRVVDLLWFPTGGGKTEAYLGITAFSIFLRRLRNPSDDGVTVIMRYTLRLLTLQQFERASMLILACELLRKKYGIEGSEFSIGLWVGGKLTPNSLDEARTAIAKQKNGAQIPEEESNPCQIKLCPWCGARLSPADYEVQKLHKRMIIRCPDKACAFHNVADGLPVHIIDEAIYAHLPTFIVATVDKFAQIPLSEKPAALFGISPERKPPELIIQDELHLISGPLGTVTGIYEAAITKLCERDGIGAKVIASTATIRNAKKQILALYGKNFTQFPPQGITQKDSYFAVESTPEQRPSRRYVGVMGVGTTATTALIRINAVVLFASRYLVSLRYPDEVVDNFWTITGYFNSLRELGGASTQILDDVQSRFVYLATTKFPHLKLTGDSKVRYDHLVELTSRMNNSDITDIIQDRLKRAYHDGRHRDVYDFVLASNMISVGVDVSRLGTMVVAGQPKTNAEYIQATSRVGRNNPGLVITMYNPTRSRDRSHYEQFFKYHSALYRYVEATSLTPFADRARDRGLHALYVSLCRYLVPGLLDNSAAGYYDAESPEVEKITDMIIQYVNTVDPEELDAVIAELQDISDDWAAETGETLPYKDYRGGKCLLKNDMANDRFRMMNSMRNVDAQSGIYLLGR